MPRPAIGIRLGVRHLGDRRMRPAPLVPGRRTVGGGADQRMPEPDTDAKLAQPRLDGRRRRFCANAL